MLFDSGRDMAYTIEGKYANALITTNNIEEQALAQVIDLINNEASLGSKIAIMPDVHAGKGSVIGTTMTIVDRVVPNLVGVDLGCGVLAVRIDKGELNFERLQTVIENFVPSGFGVHKYEDNLDFIFKDLKMPLNEKSKSHIAKSLGTLGGGNHFISVESDGVDNYLCIHTGSRNLGSQVAKFYQELAISQMESQDFSSVIAELKAKGETHKIAATLAELKKNKKQINKELAYLTGSAMEDYLWDASLAQTFAWENRTKIARVIFENMDWEWKGRVHSVHNYVSVQDKVLRKGAVAAPIGELFVVPLNMKDGTLICRGRENAEWNQSAPHGAGRAMSRRAAKDNLSLETFKEEMKGIWSASVGQSTLDEAPGAYKPSEEIKSILSEKYEIVTHLKTLYNFKASDETE